MEKVIPTSLNYADIKPEAIENMVKLVRFTPTANVTDSLPNDVVRFHLQSNGFFDPYSAYIYLDIDFLPNILTITAAAQATNAARVRGNETTGYQRIAGKFLDRSAHSFIQRLIIRSQGTELERIEQYDVMAAMINDMIYSAEQKSLHHYEGFPASSLYIPGDAMGYSQNPLAFNCGDVGLYVRSLTGNLDPGAGGVQLQDQGVPTLLPNGTIAMKGFAYPAVLNANTTLIVVDTLEAAGHLVVDTGNAAAGTPGNIPASTIRRTFCIPIYSGLIGVCMPDKKLIPLSLLPLEVEFALNPHAIYTTDPSIPREYKVKKFEIFAHMLFFEQEVHRSLEQVVAQQGIFIHFNTFYLAPITVNAGGADNPISAYASVNVHFKSINAVHWVFIYSGFENSSSQRKLNFASHNLTSMQIRNGTELIPSEPIRGDMRLGARGEHSPFLIETYKGWNKMHDPQTDGALTVLNYASDDLANQAIYGGAYGHYSLMIKQSVLGRCQYAISMEGEELGKDRSTITGRKGLVPFDINLVGIKRAVPVSYTIPFVRADMVVFVRPDLVVTTLGR